MFRISCSFQTICTCCPRKRRRQNWHSKHKLKNKAVKKHATIDQGEWERPPAKARKQTFIEDKLQVVRLWNKLKAQKQEAFLLLHKSLRGMRQSEKDEIVKQRIEARKIVKQNILEECRRIYPKIVGKTQVWKWAEQADREHWESIPTSDRVRWTEVSGTWREKMNLSKKGRSFGGYVPMEIQCELDRLLAEHSMGMSDISERKDAVSGAQIESWTQRRTGLS